MTLAMTPEFNEPKFVEEFIRLIQSLGVGSALEVGARSGELLAALDFVGIDGQGLEIDQAAVEKANSFLAGLNSYARVRYVPGGLMAWKPMSQFPLVFSSGVLEHYSRSDAQAMIKKMAEISSKFVVNLVPNAGCKPYMVAKARTWADWKDEDAYTVEELVVQHELAGLTVCIAGTMAPAWGRVWALDVECAVEELPYLVYVVGKVRQHHEL